MFNSRKIEIELEELVAIHENGGGFGDPEAKEEHERKIELLKHRAIQQVSKRSNRIAILALVTIVINAAIFTYQVFWK